MSYLTRPREARFELVCGRCIRGRRVRSSTVVPMEERSQSFTAPVGQGGKMQGDCGHYGFVLYTVELG